MKKSSGTSMFLRQPATRWQDALPCGNGPLGALVYGHVRHELILVNHEQLWFRTPKPVLPDVSGHLGELRRLLAAGRYDQAKNFLWDRLREKDPRFAEQLIDPYHPAFDIEVTTRTTMPFRRYRRELDLETGEAHVRWMEGQTACVRSVFVSRADDVIVVRVHTDGPARLPVSFKLKKHEIAPFDDNWFQPGQTIEDARIDFSTTASAPFLTVTGRYADGREFGGLAKVSARGGRISVVKDAVQVEGAREILLVLKVFANAPAGPSLRELRAQVARLPASYALLLRRHVRLHAELFSRMKLDLGGVDPRSNEELLMDAYDGGAPSALVRKMAGYGRYLLISSSRPGGWPANLQGIWNGNYVPAWWSDFHNDENVQMCYWQALAGHMDEVLLPYVDFYESRLADWRENARKIYGCRGVLAPISESTDGRLFPGAWINWTAGAGWISQLVYDYWLFTGDRKFLRDRVIPFLREVASFYEDFLVEGPDGKLLFAPSLSPENAPDIPGRSIVTVNAAMDVAVAREVLGNLCTACGALGIEKDAVARWRRMLAKLPPYAVNGDGALKEWLHPDLKDNYHHRHLSHIYPVFPGYEINLEDTPGLFKAARVAVEKRLVVGLQSQTGWSFAHMACIYARLGEGDRALECLELILRACTGPNLFTYHNDWRGQGLSTFWGHEKPPPFQIDANMGFTAAVQEMLLNSRPGFIALLPALPAKWKKGRISGMMARGGIEVTLQWGGGQAKASMRSRTDQAVVIRTCGRLALKKCTGLHIGRTYVRQGYHYVEAELVRDKVAKFFFRVL